MANYSALQNRLSQGEDLQTYSFREIEEIIEEPISPVYINRRTFLQSKSRFQIYANRAGFVLSNADYQNQTLTFLRENNQVVNIPQNNNAHINPVVRQVSNRALDPNDLGKNLDEAISYFKNNWRSTGDNPRYVAFRNTYSSINDVYYNAAKKAYSASVNNRIPLFDNTFSQNERVIAKEESFEYLKDRFIELFNKEEMSFDIFSNWEREVALHIRNSYRNRGRNHYTLGNAQKLINLALKYILSSNIINYNSHVFLFCFFPIDARIQRILKKQLQVDYLHVNGVPQTRQPSWARSDNWADIVDYQTRAREAILEYNYYSPLVWEITHWND